MAHALSRPRLGPRQGARHALQHRRRYPHGARDRRRCRTATGRAATPSAGTATRPSSATCASATASRSTPIRSASSSTPRGERFVDEGADFRNYTYAKYGRAILEQPGQFAWQVFDAKVPHLLRDEYRIKQVTKVTRRHARGAGRQARGRRRGAFLRECSAFNAAVSTDVPFDPNVKDGRAHRGPRRAEDPTGPIRSIRRRSRPTRSPAASPSPSAACGSTPRPRHRRRRRADPRALCRRRAGRRPLLLQLSRRHRADVGRGVRTDCWRLGRPRITRVADRVAIRFRIPEARPKSFD